MASRRWGVGQTGCMARFEVTIDSTLPAPEAWRRVLHLRRHGDVIPLTTLRGDALDAAGLHEGSRFVARTGLGPLAFDDEMELETYAPPTGHRPGTAVIRKLGDPIHGVIELHVLPSPSGCSVSWRQRIEVAGVPRPLDPVVSRVARAAYGRTLRELLLLA
jgi:hypothetical protein